MTERTYPPMTEEENRSSLQVRLKWLMFFRIAVATILLISAAAVRFRVGGSIANSISATFFPLSGLFFFLSILYVPILRYSKNLTKVANTQSLIDIIVITVAVYLSGGVSSPLSFLYVLAVMSATIVTYRKGGYWAASLSAVFYGIMVNLEYYNLLPPMAELITGLPHPLPKNILYNLASTVITFYLVAFLSGYIAIQAKIAEDELREKTIDYQDLEALNKNIIRNISSGLMTYDMGGRITSFNLAAEQITGYSLEKVYGRDITTVFPEFKIALTEAINLDAPDLSRWHTWFKRSDGKDYYLGFSLSALKDKNAQHIGEIAVFRDLTDLKAMERELKKADRLASIGRFAAGVAHEIRNPLASISGSIEILTKRRESNGDDQDTRLMEIVLREIDRLDILITDFLNYAKPSKPNKEKFDINDLIRELIELFANYVSHGKNINIKSDLSVQTVLFADKMQLKQVLWNLIINSIEAIDHEGEIVIKTRTEVDNERDFATISIHDNGSGISSENVEKIFDPFYTSKESGTGLGLSIANSIIESHSGSLIIESAIENGTTFTVKIPVSDCM